MADGAELVKKRIAGVAVALALANLMGCATIADSEADTIILPWAGIAVLSFEPVEPTEPPAAEVNAEVRRLLNDREEQESQQLVAAR
jgi:hypothetical protein